MRVRFSPALTGALDIGGARTALLNHLIASRGGALVLRIEDADPTRTMSGAEDALLADLRWLGITWSEGPDAGGPYAPYRQSERTDAHASHLAELTASHAAYRCFCTAKAVAAERAEDEKAGGASRCHDTCRALSSEESEARASAGEPYAWRFAVPVAETVLWEDAVQGEISVRSEDIGDFVLADSDGTFTRVFASWADDVDMHIALVVRGDGDISMTPRQILLSRAAGVEPLAYGHLPSVTSPDGAPLCESVGHTGITELRDTGYLASAVVEYLALLGWSDPDDRENPTLSDVEQAFSLDRVSKAPCVHDPERLRTINARHLRALPHDALVRTLGAYMSRPPGWADFDALFEAARDEVVVASDIVTIADFVVSRPSQLSLDAEAHAALVVVSAALEAADPGSYNGEALVGRIRRKLKAAGLQPNVGLEALRIALTGQESGLPLTALLSIMGVAEALIRIDSTQVDTHRARKR
jgi:glutamyl-tRNA synthetase